MYLFFVCKPAFNSKLKEVKKRDTNQIVMFNNELILSQHLKMFCRSYWVLFLLMLCKANFLGCFFSYITHSF